MQFHDGQILRISDLSVPARVSDDGFGRNPDNSGDYLRVREVREDRYPSSFGYSRKDGEGWTDIFGRPVAIELIDDAPKPYRAGEEPFFTEIMIAICEGQELVFPPTAGRFAEAVRNHVATEGCGERWRTLALARLRGGHAHTSFCNPEEFIRLITALEEECLKSYQRRENFFERQRGA